MKHPCIHFSDLHTNRYTQFSQHHDRLKNCLKVIDDIFKYAIHHDAKTITFGGDLGDLPKWMLIEGASALFQRFDKWFKKCPDVTLYADSGNHDHHAKNYYDKPAKTLLSIFATAFPDRFILIDNKTLPTNPNCYIVGIPYYESKSCFDKALEDRYQEVKALKQANKKAVVTLLIHQTPEGIYNKHIRTETSPADPRYAVFDMIWDGHIHTKQIISKKFVVAGNPLHRDLGDIGDEKGIWLTDLANPTDYEFISRKGRYPEYRRIQADKITEEDQQTSFVVPIVDRKAIIVEGSASVEEFSNALDIKDLLTNYWKQAQGSDEKLLNIGLSLIG